MMWLLNKLLSVLKIAQENIARLTSQINKILQYLPILLYTITLQFYLYYKYGFSYQKWKLITGFSKLAFNDLNYKLIVFLLKKT